MPISPLRRIDPQSGCAFEIYQGQALEIWDPFGEQVADLALYSRSDRKEYFSSGRTLDYNGRIFLTTGDVLYSNRSTQMMRIERDDAGRHDYLLTPCSARMFEILRDMPNHPSCHGNLAMALRPFGISDDDIHSTFNVFMRVEINSAGSIAIRTPSSKAGDRIAFRALTDLIVGLTACSSEHTNNGVCKPIDFRVFHDNATKEGACVHTR
jgi:uncharacterized protein